jgi:hypothetical protein
MTNELRKLIYFTVILAALGTIIGIMITHPSMVLIFINCISMLCTLGLALIFIAVFLVLLFVVIIVVISKPISNIGVHYKAKPFYGFREPLFSNVIEVFLNNLILSIPLYLTIVYLLNPENFFVTSGSSTIDIVNEFKAALVIIPGYLLSIRLLTNPVKKESRFPILRSLLGLTKKFYQGIVPRDRLKERIISFYFSLTATFFVVMVMIWLYKTIPLGGLASLSDPLNLTFWGKIFQSLAISFIPHFNDDLIINLITILVFVGAYLVALFLLTVTCELILSYHELVDPEEQEPSVTLWVGNILDKVFLR